jgi:UDP-GlcNAc:undecaprenyl-phosphate/decaprenyl-phosphate GlcNAc-1-phosphate transferase
VNALSIGCVSLLLTCIAMPLVRWAAMRSGFIDRPRGPLKPQTRAVPYGGGIAVLIGIVGALLWKHAEVPIVPLVGITVVFLLGIADDLHGVSPRARLVVELIAGSTLCVLWPSGSSQWPRVLASGALSAFLAGATMNACNMTDGSDGLLGTVSLCAASGLVVGWLLAGEALLAWVAIATCGGIVAFLFFNWPPARVYLGDSGAYLMGFMLTALCIPTLSSWQAVIGVMCIMAPLELELLTTVLRRMRGHQELTMGDRRHIYDVVHFSLGQSAARIDVVYAVAGLGSSLIGVLVWRGAPIILGAGWLVLLSILVVLLNRKPTSGKVEIP